MGRDRLIEGGPGHGVMDGTRPATAPAHSFGKQSIIGVAFPMPDDLVRRLHPLFTHHRIRSLGSGALTLAYTALGLLDGCVDYRSRAWDIAACHALARAVGCPVQFLGAPLFPIDAFHITQPPSPFYAGGDAFRAAMAGWLEA